MEAPPGIEPGMEVLQTSALPLGDGALRTGRSKSPDWRPRREIRRLESGCLRERDRARCEAGRMARVASELAGVQGAPAIKFGAGNGIRTRDFDLGKVALYH
jgi:hypothetical protein